MTEQKPFAFLKEQRHNVFQEKIIQTLDYLGLEPQSATPHLGLHEELSVLLTGNLAQLNLIAQQKNLPDFASTFAKLANIEIHEQGNQLVEIRFKPISGYSHSSKF